jgi:hypothetical protein
LVSQTANHDEHQAERKRLRVEFHCHTIASKDCLVTPKRLVEGCRRKGIDKVIVTDHNSIQGALRAKEIDPERVIVGEEVKAEKGEFLAFFVSEEVPRGLPVMETIERLRAQGAFISLAHPLDPNRNNGWQEADLEALISHIDAIETFNSRCLSETYNRWSEAFALKHHLPQTVGSDAHTVFELGTSTLLLSDFHDTDSLKAALATAQKDCRMSSPMIHLTSRVAVWAKMLLPSLQN